MATSVETTFNPHVDYYPPTLLAKHGIQLSGNTAVVEVRHSTADIGWVPELAKFHQRTSLRNRDILRNAQVPKGWPKAVLHPLAWTGSELKPEDYAYDLSAVDINEIKTALSHFKSNLPTASFSSNWVVTRAKAIYQVLVSSFMRFERKPFPCRSLGHVWRVSVKMSMTAKVSASCAG